MTDEIDPGFDPDEEERIHELLRELQGLDSDTQRLAMSELKSLLGGKDNQATEIVRIAEERYRLGISEDGNPFAVPLQGPSLVRMLRGGRDSLRSELAALFVDKHGQVPSSNALANALLVLEGRAQRLEPEALHLRSARHAGRLVLDLGRPDGRVVEIGPIGWTITEPSVLFKRTKLTRPLPEPVRGGTLEPLREFLRLEESWPLIVAWIVSALDPDVAHAVLALIGQQGSGKSFAAKVLASVIDPSTAPLRSAPRDATDWAVAAAGSYVVPIDNISSIPYWFSDALCRASTGDGFVNRKLYTDDDISVLSFRRSVILTSIDPGALRGDLGDRLIRADVPAIDRERQTDRQLDATWRELHPTILGAVLDLTSAVIAELPNTKLDRLPRMADFAKTLAAVDHLLGTDGTAQYAGVGERIALDVLDGDVVAGELRTFVAACPDDSWSGLVKNLLEGLNEHLGDQRPPKGWPRTPRALGGHLRRLAPALAAVGIELTFREHTRDGYPIDIKRVCE